MFVYMWSCGGLETCPDGPLTLRELNRLQQATVTLDRTEQAWMMDGWMFLAILVNEQRCLIERWVKLEEFWRCFVRFEVKLGNVYTPNVDNPAGFWNAGK